MKVAQTKIFKQQHAESTHIHHVLCVPHSSMGQSLHKFMSQNVVQTENFEQHHSKSTLIMSLARRTAA